MTELPVSVRVPEDGAAGMDVAAVVALAAAVLLGELTALDELDELELEHAAASNAIGTREAAVETRRTLLATGGYSFNRFYRCTSKKCGCGSRTGAASGGLGALRSRAERAALVLRGAVIAGLARAGGGVQGFGAR
jgi:hypothetical protein